MMVDVLMEYMLCDLGSMSLSFFIAVVLSKRRDQKNLSPFNVYKFLSFFMKNIERCLEHPEEIGPVFQRSEKRLQIYVKYCQNKPTSEYIVSEYSNYFEVGILTTIRIMFCCFPNAM